MISFDVVVYKEVCSVFCFDFFVGILSGWRMEGVGGEDRVDPGEDLGMFEIRGKSPRAPQKFSKYMILKNVW